MEWKDILNKVRLIKEHFDRSYKCLNVERPTKEETIQHHFQILLNRLEEIRIILNVNYNRLTLSHKTAAEGFFLDLKTKVLKIAALKNIQIKLPETLHETVNLTTDNKTNTKMTQTLVEFLNTASKLITEFDGKSENLQSFIDSLQLVNLIKGIHESSAISLIKTKLKGNARNLISEESTIEEIITKLKVTVKGESVHVLSAKLMSIKQNNKTPTAYCTEIENLTKSLETAYISDGLSCELANKYSTQVAVKAITKNCSNEKVKLIMEAGQFNDMNEAVSKFVSSCTEATGQQNSVLYFSQRPTYYRGNNRRFRGRNNYPRNNNNINNNNGNNNNNNYNNRNRQRPDNNRRNRHYVRAMDSNENGSENSDHPLRSEQ